MGAISSVIERRILPGALEIVVNQCKKVVLLIKLCTFLIISPLPLFKGKENDVNQCLRRYEEDGSNYVLSDKSVTRILGCRPHDASLIYLEILDPIIDGERKGQIIATDFLFVIILSSQMSEREKYNG